MSPAADKARYDPRAVEPKWQARWDADDDFQAETYPTGESYHVLVYPPYPNGRIHMGHVRNYTIGDAVARYKRMRGMSVLHPVGFDAFGLPNELEAARQGIEPEQLTRRNIETMERQLRRLGFSYDWKSKIVTIEPEYYRWSQWLFLVLRERGLAYRKGARVEWCPSCTTSLAHEQVIDGRCWRCRTEVASRHLSQWFFRLRAYAEEIWTDCTGGPFPENIATMVRDWIGKTDGAELAFPVQGDGEPVRVFTTKPELAYGATYLALSPEHPRASELLASDRKGELQRLIERVHGAANPGELTDGLDTGRRAMHPLTRETMPIWLAAYVDPDLGTGAVMGNPCHDASDDAFGRAQRIAGKAVASPDGSPWDYDASGPYLGDGLLYGCESFSGRPALVARQDVIDDWRRRKIGRPETIFAVRDWLISRQRAWGTPIPVIHCGSCGEVPVPCADLPVRLPARIGDRRGEGNPLDRCAEFVECRCPRCDAAARRETDTMDTFIDTTWYYLRGMNPDHAGSLSDPRAARARGPSDLYVGGIEIAVPIMLYGSFVAKALRDAGHVGFSNPCRRLLAHDMVLNEGQKMSKSLGNTVDPDELVERVGADSVRLLILSLAPPLKKIEWSDSRLRGCHKFLRRVWALGLRQAARRERIADGMPRSPAERRVAQLANQVVGSVTRDMERLQPNTCITELIKFLYELEELENATAGGRMVLAERQVYHEAFAQLVTMLSPFAPHLCEELWERLGQPTRLSRAGWPGHDPSLAADETTWITVKVDARPLKRIEVPADASEEQVLARVQRDRDVLERIGDREITRRIYVPGQIVNIVTSK